LNWFEQQAYEFAGRFLVPKEKLLSEISALTSKIREFRSKTKGEDELLLEALSRIVCRAFGVSPDVIARRIRTEKIPLEPQ